MYRTHLCKELNENFENKKVKIAGWLRTIRNHGNVIFIDLYDYDCYVQCIIEKDNEKLLQIINSLKLESVISIEGIIKKRSIETQNNKISTGKIELLINSIEIINASKELPFALHQEKLNEELQMNYRFLYLRTENMQEILKKRAQIIDFSRKFMQSKDFLEVQTPLLANSSDEGARDYVVPSRLHPGKFYALPQAPQQFKQLLMASGVQKYFQVAPCFRDEDPRSDRLVGEFYQLDFEHAFATQNDILNLLEEYFNNLFKYFKPNDYQEQKFIKLSYHEALKKYGSDKPDLRNPLNLVELNYNQAPEMFKTKMANNNKFKIIAIAANVENMNSGIYNKLLNLIKNNKGNGLAYCSLKNNEWSGPLSKMINQETLEYITINSNVKEINTCFLIADENAYELGGILRNELGKNLINQNSYSFCFIVDFPMFEEKDGKTVFMHNPFCMPQNLNDEVSKMLAFQYDVVCNGYEIVSGAVRNHKLENLEKIFKYVEPEMNIDDLIKNFPVFKSFAYGVPPHAGAAVGLDRVIMLLTNQKNVRDIVAFPLNQNGENLLMNAPSEISIKLKKELNLK